MSGAAVRPRGVRYTLGPWLLPRYEVATPGPCVFLQGWQVVLEVVLEVLTSSPTQSRL